LIKPKPHPGKLTVEIREDINRPRVSKHISENVFLGVSKSRIRRSFGSPLSNEVIASPFFRIDQDAVGFADLLEALLGILIPRIAVGMALEGQLPKGFLYFLRAGFPAYAQYPVIILVVKFTLHVFILSEKYLSGHRWIEFGTRSDDCGIEASASESHNLIPHLLWTALSGYANIKRNEMKRFHSSFIKRLLFFLAVFASPILVGQTPFTPPSESWKKVEEGFEVRSMHFQGQPFQTSFKIRALRIGLDRFSVRVLDNRAFGATRMDAKTMALKAQALATINGGFFMPGYTPLGLLIVDGRETNPLRKADWGVFMIQGNQAKIIHTKEFLPDRNISQALQVGPRLVVDGRELTLKPQVARRSAVGVTYNNRVILVNTDDTDSYAQDLARVFRLSDDEGGLGCRDAMALDGGPSAQMYVEFKWMKIDIPGGWGVPNGLGVFKR
jgi:hypothetical protein